MSQDPSSATESKLYLPKLCVIPLAVREHPDLSGEAKIYLGELNVLTNKHGYCWASDEDLAEMKGVSVSCIKKWHKALESAGFVRRDTWREHIKHEEHGVIVRSRRKIYVFDTPSRKDAEVPKSTLRCEVPKFTPHCEVPKSDRIREEPLTSKEEEQQRRPSASSPSDVVVSFLTKEMKASASDIKAIAKRVKSIEDAELLVKRVKRWEDRESDAKAAFTILSRWEDWEDESKAEAQAKAQERQNSAIAAVKAKAEGLYAKWGKKLLDLDLACFWPMQGEWKGQPVPYAHSGATEVLDRLSRLV